MAARKLLITGAGSGLGLALAQRHAAMRWLASTCTRIAQAPAYLPVATPWRGPITAWRKRAASGCRDNRKPPPAAVLIPNWR